MQHTPGPWTFDYPEDDRCNVQVWSGPNQRVCFLAHDDTRENATGIANGMLIAAAPDLLEALTDLAAAVAAEVDAKPGFGGSGYLLARLTDARAAIAKATEQPEN